jgi:hypothetical protein
MSPLINEGDVVAVDGSQTNPKKLNGKIVVGWHRVRGLSLAVYAILERGRPFKPAREPHLYS